MLPKIELHTHLEFTASPDLIKQLAIRNKKKLPDSLFTLDNKFAWNTFLEFLKCHDHISQVICTPEDYRDITFNYLAESAREGVIYAELMCSPDHAALAGMSYQDQIEGIAQGIADARHQYGIEARILPTGVRQFGADKVLQVIELVVNNPHPLVVGIGLGGDEARYPAGQFAEAYRIAREAGLGVTAHAGEMVGPESIREAIDTLAITRIGHGVRLIEDPTLMQEVIARGITLECCPTSNIKLNVYQDYASHPLKKLKDAGVKITLNSDDAPYFDATIGREYEIAKIHFGFSDEDLSIINETAVHASFADKKTKQQLLEKLKV